MVFRIGFFLCFLLVARPIPAQLTGPVLYEIKLLKYMMGTQVEITAVHQDIVAAKKGIYAAFKEIERIDKRLGYHGEKSEVVRINQFAGIHPVKISDETFRILARAKSYAENFNGIFDPTIAPVEELWGFNLERSAKRPADSRIKKLLKLVNYRSLILNAKDTTAYLTTKKMKIDLGGIAKGYAIDRAVDLLRQYDVQNFILKAGGDMYVSGKKSPTEMWKIGIEHPRNAGKLFAMMTLKDCAISTSGDYERYFMQDGVRYHHILNPKTGYPSSECKSVSVISNISAEKTDALSTIIFILGADKIEADSTFKNYLIYDKANQLHLDSALVSQYNLMILNP